MKELYVFCEGPTEQNFCRQVLQNHLFPQYDGKIHSILIAHSRRHGIIHRGGVRKYSVLRDDICNMLNARQGNEVYFTSMLDLYGLPNDFPGKMGNERNPANPRPYVEALEQAFGDDIHDRRFVPHLQLHEYETLLFADVESFRYSFDNCDRQIEKLEAIVQSKPTIEHINDGEQTAPSKRIINLLPSYSGLKTTAGPDIAEYTGIETICIKCEHFNDWLTRLQHVLGGEHE